MVKTKKVKDIKKVYSEKELMDVAQKVHIEEESKKQSKEKDTKEREFLLYGFMCDMTALRTDQEESECYAKTFNDMHLKKIESKECPDGVLRTRQYYANRYYEMKAKALHDQIRIHRLMKEKQTTVQEVNEFMKKVL